MPYYIEDLKETLIQRITCVGAKVRVQSLGLGLIGSKELLWRVGDVGFLVCQVEGPFSDLGFGSCQISDDASL